MKRLAVCTLLLLLGWTARAQQAPAFGEKIDVNVALIDVIVTDSQGHQILGLDKNDFVVKENGIEQPLDSADYYTNRQLLTAQESNAPFKAERIKEGRYFIFFFDKPSDNGAWQYVTVARNAVKGFIENQMKPGDLVAIAGHDVRLKVYSDFTSDKKQLLDALAEAAKFGKGVLTAAPGDGPSILRKVDADAMMSESGTTYEGLEVLGQALRPITGRKNLILFSAGIYEPGQEIRNGMILNKSRYYEPMIEALNSANVTVYAMNLLRGDSSDMPAIHQTLDLITSDTNGDYYRYPVAFEPLLKKIEQVNNGYYLLSYGARHPKGTTGFQKVDVSIRNHPEFKVKAREGYTFGE